MYNRLISFLHKNKIFTEAQNGFRKGKCIETTTQALIKRIQEIEINQSDSQNVQVN
jgi:hypothetical protein